MTTRIEMKGFPPHAEVKLSGLSSTLETLENNTATLEAHTEHQNIDIILPKRKTTLTISDGRAGTNIEEKKQDDRINNFTVSDNTEIVFRDTIPQHPGQSEKSPKQPKKCAEIVITRTTIYPTVGNF